MFLSRREGERGGWVQFITSFLSKKLQCSFDILSALSACSLVG